MVAPRTSGYAVPRMPREMTWLMTGVMSRETPGTALGG